MDVPKSAVIEVYFARLDRKLQKVSAALDPAGTKSRIRRSFLIQLMLGNLAAKQRHYLQIDNEVATLWYTTNRDVFDVQQGTFDVQTDLEHDIILASSEYEAWLSAEQALQDIILPLVMKKRSQGKYTSLLWICSSISSC